MGLGSIRFTSPRITGHRHRSVRSPSPAALELLRNVDRPLQHSLCGVGVSGTLPVRKVPQVMSPASGVTQSVGDDGAVTGPPNSGGTSGRGLGTPKPNSPPVVGGDEGDGLVPGKVGGDDGRAPG